MDSKKTYQAVKLSLAIVLFFICSCGDKKSTEKKVETPAPLEIQGLGDNEIKYFDKKKVTAVGGVPPYTFAVRTYDYLNSDVDYCYTTEDERIDLLEGYTSKNNKEYESSEAKRWGNPDFKSKAAINCDTGELQVGPFGQDFKVYVKDSNNQEISKVVKVSKFKDHFLNSHVLLPEILNYNYSSNSLKAQLVPIKDSRYFTAGFLLLEVNSTYWNGDQSCNFGCSRVVLKKLFLDGTLDKSFGDAGSIVMWAQKSSDEQINIPADALGVDGLNNYYFYFEKEPANYSGQPSEIKFSTFKVTRKSKQLENLNSHSFVVKNLESDKMQVHTVEDGLFILGYSTRNSADSSTKTIFSKLNTKAELVTNFGNEGIVEVPFGLIKLRSLPNDNRGRDLFAVVSDEYRGESPNLNYLVVFDEKGKFLPQLCAETICPLKSGYLRDFFPVAERFGKLSTDTFIFLFNEYKDNKEQLIIEMLRLPYEGKAKWEKVGSYIFNHEMYLGNSQKGSFRNVESNFFASEVLLAFNNSTLPIFTLKLHGANSREKVWGNLETTSLKAGLNSRVFTFDSRIVFVGEKSEIKSYWYR